MSHKGICFRERECFKLVLNCIKAKMTSDTPGPSLRGTVRALEPHLGAQMQPCRNHEKHFGVGDSRENTDVDDDKTAPLCPISALCWPCRTSLNLKMRGSRPISQIRKLRLGPNRQYRDSNPGLCAPQLPAPRSHGVSDQVWGGWGGGLTVPSALFTVSNSPFLRSPQLPHASSGVLFTVDPSG